jgi:hypothetical protein
MAQTFFVGDENKRLEQLKTNSQTDICLVLAAPLFDVSILTNRASSLDYHNMRQQFVVCTP